MSLKNDKKFIIQIREDGYINATALCKNGGKLFADYNRNKKTHAFLEALNDILRIPIDNLIESKSGKYGGTFVHPMIATNLAQWISPEFSVKVTLWIEEWKKLNNNNKIYNDELQKIKGTEYESKEKEIQKRLHKDLGGEIEVKTEFGYIDLLTKTEIIEIKVYRNWKSGVGQLIVYSEEFPVHRKRLHLFDIDLVNINKIKTICAKHKIIITYEQPLGSQNLTPASLEC